MYKVPGKEATDLSKNRIWTKDFTFLMAGLLMVACANYYFASSIAVYAGLIGRSGAYAGVLTASFYFGSVGMRLVNGTLVQRFGSKRLMIVGAALCMLACLAHNFVSAAAVLVLCRVLHGCGYSIFSTASGTAASYLVPPDRLAEGMGYFTIGNVLAMALGPSIALWIVSGGTMGEFHRLFWSAAAICAAALALSCLIRSDGGGAGKVRRGEDRPELPATFMGFEKGVVLPSLISFLMTFSYSPVIVYLAAYGLTKGWTNIGAAFTMYALGLLGSRLFTGRLSDRRGPDCVMLPAYFLGAAALCIIAFCGALWQLYAAMVLLGLCIGAYNPQINVFCITRCSAERRGTATAASNGAGDLGLAVGSAVTSIFIKSLGYKFTFLQGACGCLATLVIYFFTMSGFAQRRRSRERTAKTLDRRSV